MRKSIERGSYIKLCCLHEMLRLLLLLMVVKPVVMALASVTSMAVVMVFFADVAATLLGD